MSFSTRSNFSDVTAPIFEIASSTAFSHIAAFDGDADNGLVAQACTNLLTSLSGLLSSSLAIVTLSKVPGDVAKPGSWLNHCKKYLFAISFDTTYSPTLSLGIGIKLV